MTETAPDIQLLNEQVEKASRTSDLIRAEIGKTIIGQTHMIDKLLIGLLANGHVLLEGVPGLAKTLAINSLSKTIKADFSRIQFTPDLLPADVVGTLIYNPKEESFKVKKGPFSRILFWLTRSIELRLRFKARCWRPCRKGR